MSSRHVLPFLAVSTLLLASCTAIIGGEGTEGGSGATPGGGSSTPGGGGVETPADISPFYGPIVTTPSSSTRFVRLNHVQYENTVRDVLRLSAPLGLSDAFVAEPLRSTFDTNGAILTVAPDLRLDYQTAAESLGGTVAHDPTLLAQVAPANADAAARAKAFIESFGLRVYRRPLAADEVTRYQALFDQGPTLIGSGDNFADGVELVVGAFFQSPHFLYRSELSSAVVNGKILLNDYEIASRLSYGLTNTMPDDLLFTAAANKQLALRDGLVAEAKRLLATPAAELMVENFHEQLFVMREYDTISKNQTKFPQFVEGIAEDLTQEALAFVQHVVFEQQAGMSELMTAPYTFANARVRAVYGLPPATGDQNAFLKVDLDPAQRAGMLTQPGFLAAHGEQDTPNLIMRGVHIAKRLLCLDIPPPDVVPALPPLAAGSTNRQRVEELTKGAACSGCHTQIINPLGSAFESLDGVGKFRTTENNLPVDSSGSYSLDGETFSYTGPVELIKEMAASYQMHACYSRNWVEYLYGRSVDKTADADLINQAGRLSRTTESVQDLITNLVATEAFTSRMP
jgi:hypothetical protein